MNGLITKIYVDENGNEHSYETLSDDSWQEVFDNTDEPMKPDEAFRHIEEKYRSVLDDSTITEDLRNEIEYMILQEKKSVELHYYNMCGSKREFEYAKHKYKEAEREYHLRIQNNTYDKERNEKLLKAQLAREKEFITPEEFELLFDLSIETQKQYRSRKNNPIPVFGKRGKGNKILYRRVDVEKWNERR